MVIPVFHPQFNALAGSCHTNTSLHYSGMAVDLQLNWSGTSRDPNQTKAYQGACTKAGGWSHNGTHVHRQIGLIWHYFLISMKILEFLQFNNVNACSHNFTLKFIRCTIYFGQWLFLVAIYIVQCTRVSWKSYLSLYPVESLCNMLQNLGLRPLSGDRGTFIVSHLL